MKKFAQIAVLIAGLAGLSACASSDASEMGGKELTVKEQLNMCQERVARLEQMNKSCYRK